MTLSATMFEITLMAVLIGAGFQFGVEVMRVLWVIGRAFVTTPKPVSS
jgi:hypothetical protein